MNKIINLAIQVLPTSDEDNAYEIIDKAIEVIAKSGIKYKVCPFETVLEGTYEHAMQVLTDVRTACFAAGAKQVIVNMKLQEKATESVFIDDKMEKYKD